MPRLRPRAVLTADDLPVVASYDPATDPATGGAAGDGHAADGGEAAAYFGRLVTYIPAEIIAVYQTIHVGLGGSAIQGSDTAGAVAIDKPALLWIGLFLLAVTPFWTWFSTTAVGEKPPIHQMVNAFAAFAIWLVMVGNPVQLWVAGWVGDWQPYYGSAAMVLVVGIVFPLVEQIVKRLPKPS